MLIWIAIANAILWGGVITFLLLSLVHTDQMITAQAARLEARLSEKPGANSTTGSSAT